MKRHSVSVGGLGTLPVLLAVALISMALVGCGSPRSGPAVVDGVRPDRSAQSLRSDDPTPVDEHRPDRHRVGDLVDAARIGYGADGAIAIVTIDGRRVTTALGAADADGTPINVAMRFRAGSITKTFTATLLLDQVAQGSLDLDDEVAAVVGSPLRSEPPVTVRMLLDHTSGIFDTGNEGDPMADVVSLTDPELLTEVDDLMDRAATGEPVVASPRLIVGLAETHPRDFEPGSAFGYSNTNYQIAGMLIETVSGQPLTDVLADRIADPLALTSMSLAPFDTRSPEIRGATVDLDTGEVIDPTDDLFAFGNGASGGLLTNAEELQTFLSAVVHDSLLPEDLRVEMLRPTPQSGNTYGMGIASYELSCGRFLGHEGRVSGTVSIALVNADSPDDGVVVAMNRAIGDAGLVSLAEDLVCGR